MLIFQGVGILQSVTDVLLSIGFHVLRTQSQEEVLINEMSPTKL